MAAVLVAAGLVALVLYRRWGIPLTILAAFFAATCLAPGRILGPEGPAHIGIAGPGVDLTTYAIPVIAGAGYFGGDSAASRSRSSGSRS